MSREAVLQWVSEQYGTEPDYPWNDIDAVLRHHVSKKWYGVILRVSRSHLHLPGEDMVDVLNLKCDPLLIGMLRKKPGFLPAYHMNKELWITILLDGIVSMEEITPLIEMSYGLTEAKGKKAKSKQP